MRIWIERLKNLAGYIRARGEHCCPRCWHVAYKLYHHKEWYCDYCPGRTMLDAPSRLLWGIGSLANSSSGKMSAAHYDDISRRRVCPEDGRSVYRDRGSKSIVVNK